MSEVSKINVLVEHFFRHESGKMISVLTKYFGPSYLEMVEDIVQDSIVEAINNWTYNEIPDNPSAWLYKVAKNKALNAIKRRETSRQVFSEIGANIERFYTIEDAFSEQNIQDDQLRMMFTCCHPSISKDSQIALILKTLCGFSIGEIAKAFLTNNENINKRLVRARATIRKSQVPFEVPHKAELEQRIDVILESIYLIFNEGYSASTGILIIREELCSEAIRLAEMLHEFKAPQHANILALTALMQLNSSRFKARIAQGSIITLQNQNRGLWDFTIMEKGFKNLRTASEGNFISKYHILATISAYHCSAKNFDSTNWEEIIKLYDKLLDFGFDPVVILNRTVAVLKARGAGEALQELNSIQNENIMRDNYLFYSTKFEIQFALEDFDSAAEALKNAIELAPLDAEKQMLKSRFETCFQKKC
ncbi:MAG: sigma-70 family RNA polymerase sigma factor [Flavobacteriales bacterium]|nr:sigma-70 family RNA polymerase sigma factor [Flavobacteriales bacterium]